MLVWWLINYGYWIIWNFFYTLLLLSPIFLIWLLFRIPHLQIIFSLSYDILLSFSFLNQYWRLKLWIISRRLRDIHHILIHQINICQPFIFLQLVAIPYLLVSDFIKISDIMSWCCWNRMMGSNLWRHWHYYIIILVLAVLREVTDRLSQNRFLFNQKLVMRSQIVFLISHDTAFRVLNVDVWALAFHF